MIQHLTPFSLCNDDATSKEMVRVLFPLTCDTTTEYIADYVTLTLERVLGPVDGDEFTARMFQYAIAKCYQIIIKHSSADRWVRSPSWQWHPGPRLNSRYSDPDVTSCSYN